MERNDVVMIQLDRVRELRFSHRSMKRWSAHTGRSIGEIDTEGMGPAELEELVYFMLETDAKAHGEELKLEDMEELLDMAPLGTVYKTVAAAVTAAFPDEAKAAQGEKN